MKDDEPSGRTEDNKHLSALEHTIKAIENLHLPLSVAYEIT